MRNNYLRLIRSNKSFLVVLVIAFIGAFASIFFSHSHSSAQKLLRFNYVLKNTSPDLARDIHFDVAMPMEVKGIQRVLSVNTTENYQINKHDNGEQHVSFVIDQIVPFGTKLITFTVIAELTDKPGKDIDDSMYLSAEKYIETKSPVVKRLAAKLSGSSSEDTAKNIYEWLVNNVISSGYTADSYGAKYLLEKKTGDCTEVMYAFIALARANGIPARGVRGLWLPQGSSVINAADYHDWAEFYDGDQWVLVDANKKVFSTAGHNYLGLGLYDSSNSNRFTISNNNISVSFSQ